MIEDKHKINAFDFGPLEQEIFKCVRAEAEARAKTEAAEGIYRNAIKVRYPNAVFAGGSRGGVACVNNQMAYHVYDGHHCIFCGCNDYDD